MSSDFTPQPSDWIKDGVGMTPEGLLAIRKPGIDPVQCYATHPAAWIGYMEQSDALKAKVSDLERAVNAREPAVFLAMVLAQLDSNANEAAAMREDTPAGKVMLGQTQAYRDAAALIRSYLPLATK